MTQEQAAAYLAGIIDGEGHVCSPASHGRCIEIVNTEADIVNATTAACKVLGIGVKARWRQPASSQRQSSCVVRISNLDNLVRVWRLVPIQSQRKKAALQTLLDAYTKKTVLPMVEELAAMYYGGMSVNEISVRHGVGIHAIMHRLKSHGVLFRSRGEASKMGQARKWRAA